MDKFVQKRRYFRIEYPTNDQPTLKIGTKIFKVLDVSEEGLRFEITPLHGFVQKDRIVGEIDFNKRARLSIKGTIIRTTLAYCVVSLSETIPLPIIMSEQRYLVANYGGLSKPA